MAAKVDERQDKAVEMLVKLKSDLAGMKTGKREQERDRRFVEVILVLLPQLNSEEEVMNWLQRPCGCLECHDLSSQPTRLDLLNSAYGTKHLLQQFEADRAAAFGD